MELVRVSSYGSPIPFHTSSAVGASAPASSPHRRAEKKKKKENHNTVHARREDWLLSIVVERKTLADLEASVKSARYVQQRHALSRCPSLRLGIWIVEGSWSGHASRSAPYHRRWAFRRGGCRRNPPPSYPSSAAKEGKEEREERIAMEQRREQSYIRRLYSACGSLSLHSKFVVVRTRSVQETAVFLRELSRTIMREVALWRVSKRRERKRRRRRREAEARACPHHHTRDVAKHSPCACSSLMAQQTAGDMAETARGERERESGRGLGWLMVGSLTSSLASLQAYQHRLRAHTALPRLLQCFPGCSAALAVTLSRKFGSLYRLWLAAHPPGSIPASSPKPSGADLAKLATEMRLSPAQERTFFMIRQFLMTWSYT